MRKLFALLIALAFADLTHKFTKRASSEKLTLSLQLRNLK